ncbi:MAG: translesion DNA synthesis-associated protein ImuA [Lautropia sp.]
MTALPASCSGQLPPAVAAALWRGDALGTPAVDVTPTGWAALDRELPGGGWPRRTLTELLTAQPALLEWRLLGPALAGASAAGGQVVVIGPPRPPHVPGLLHAGLDERHLVWIQAETPAERLWCTEQIVRAGAGAVVAWLPQARPEQIRRLQLAAQASDGLFVTCRPEAAQHEASAAPLRVQATVGLDWTLQVRILKRRGPVHDSVLELPSVPGGLEAVLTPRLRQPSRLFSRDPAHVGRPAPEPGRRLSVV